MGILTEISLQIIAIEQHHSAPRPACCPTAFEVMGSRAHQGLALLKDPRSASKKQKNTAELMPLLIARGPTPLQAAHIAENLPVSRVSGH